MADLERLGRNVIATTIPTLSKLHRQTFEFAKTASEHLLPRTSAYHEIWLDKKMVAGDAVKDFEPLYGDMYLPRKVITVYPVCLYALLKLCLVSVQNRYRSATLQ